MTNDLVRVLMECQISQAGLSIRDFMPSIIAALVGALAGAGTAWWLQVHLLRSQERREDQRDRQKEIDERYDAGNRALFVLFCQANAMLNLKNQIQPYAKHPQRWIYLPIQAHDYGYMPTIDLSSLTFMLDRKFCPNVLRDLFFAQSSFKHATYVLRNRNRLRTEITDQELANALHPLTEKELQTFTDALFEAVDKAYKKLKAIQPKLVDCLKKLRPGLEPMTFEMIEGAQDH